MGVHPPLLLLVAVVDPEEPDEVVDADEALVVAPPDPPDPEDWPELAVEAPLLVVPVPVELLAAPPKPTTPGSSHAESVPRSAHAMPAELRSFIGRMLLDSEAGPERRGASGSNSDKLGGPREARWSNSAPIVVKVVARPFLRARDSARRAAAP